MSQRIQVRARSGIATRACIGAGWFAVALCAPVSAAGPPAAAAPVSAAPASLCGAGEAVLFSCRTGRAKTASLCLSRPLAASSRVRYVFGAPGRIELAYPGAGEAGAGGAAASGGFRRTSLGFAGNTGGYAYSFTQRGHDYVVYSVSGARGLSEQGVMVAAGEPRKLVARLPCARGSVVENEDEAVFDLVRAWPADPQIQRHGLPSP